MKRDYEALFGAYYEKYFKFIEENMSPSEALARTSGEFEGVANMGEMEKAVVNIAEGRIYLTHSKIFEKSKNYIIEELNSIDFQKLKLQITEDDYNDLVERKDIVLEALEELEIDYNPYTWWYYYEIESKVKHYFLSCYSQTNSGLEIIDKVMERFERDCDNTLSENIVIKVTLTELLLRRNNLDVGDFYKNIKEEILEFDNSDVDTQLSQSEKEDLSQRITDILLKIN